MSRHQKGRKHRSVNRTPRPVRPVGPARSGPPARPGAAPEQAHQVAAPQSVTPTAPAPPPAPTVDDLGEADGPVFSNKVRDGGLGQHAARTWQELKAYGGSGTTAEDLAASVGYTLPTIRKHLSGLARYGMAEEGAEGWRPTTKSQWDVAAEHDLPVRTRA